MAQRVSKTTTDHDTIQRWAEARGGKPAQVASTAEENETRIIRIDFPGSSGEGTPPEISWDEWFKKFDQTNLALVYEETTASGERSNFNELVGRETALAREEGTRTSRRAPRAGGDAGDEARASTGSRKGKTAAGRRQATRLEAARSTRSKKPASKTSTARGNPARGRKASASTGGPRSPAKRASAPRKSTGRSTGRGKTGK
jgi:hypothetical protein